MTDLFFYPLITRTQTIAHQHITIRNDYFHEHGRPEIIIKFSMALTCLTTELVSGVGDDEG